MFFFSGFQLVKKWAYCIFDLQRSFSHYVFNVNVNEYLYSLWLRRLTLFKATRHYYFKSCWCDISCQDNYVVWYIQKTKEIKQAHHPVMKRNVTLTFLGQLSAWYRRSYTLYVRPNNILNICCVHLKYISINI